MADYIAFLRAVNVGKRQVKMAALRDQLAANEFSNIETFIASGNLKVTSSMRSATKVERTLEALLEDWLHFDVPTMARSPQQLKDAFAAGAKLRSPLPGQPRHYLAFLRDEPTASAAKELQAWDEEGERGNVIGREAHLWLSSPTPKLTNARMEKILDTVGTARDWKTVTRLVSIWG